MLTEMLLRFVLSTRAKRLRIDAALWRMILQEHRPETWMPHRELNGAHFCGVPVTVR